MPITARLVALIRSSRGNVIVAAAAALPVVIGAAGLGTDTMQWVLWKRQLQRSADSAALSGAFALAQSKSASTSASADIVRTNEVRLSATPTIESPPSTGAGTGNSSAVRIVLETNRNLPFSSLFLASAPTIKAEATAAIVNSGNYCVISLEPTTTVGITMSGNSTVDMGCGMATNSKASSAVTAGGSSRITATPVAAVGGLQSSNNYVGATTLKPYQIPQADPFASLPDPVVPTGACQTVNAGPHDVQTIANPTGTKCIRNVNIKGTVTFSPGVYYVDGGSFSVGAQGKVIGTGVTFILTSSNAATQPNTIAQVEMNGGAEISLSAPTTGTYKGVIFYQDRRATDQGDNKVNGNTNSYYQGAFYFPKQELKFNGTAGMSTDCMQIVSRRVVFLGNSSIQNVCPNNSGSNAFTGSAVRLIG